MEEEISQPIEFIEAQIPLVDNSVNNVQHTTSQIPYILPTYDPVLITHPIFTHENDPFLASLTNGVKSLISQTPDVNVVKNQANRWLNQLIAITFNNIEIDSLKMQFQQLGLSFDTICGRFIGHDEIYFRCLDCDKFKDTTSSIYALLCSQCFENSNHDGHRVLMVKKDSNSSATCDCGDHTAFDHEGFCKDHQPKDFCVKETLSKFPHSFLQKYLIVLKNAFYGIASLFELSFAATEQKTKDLLSAFAQLTLEGTLVFCGICSGEINEAFLVVFGELFKGKFLNNYNQVWHICEDITAEKGVKAVDTNGPHACACTIAGSLLRIINTAEHEIQVKLHKVLVECAKESNFKVFLLKEFTKYMHFLYTQNYTRDEYDDNTNSKLLNMKAQLYGSEESCLEVLNSGYFQNLLSVMRKAVHNSAQVNHEVYHVVSDVRSALMYFLNSKNKSSALLLKNSDLMSQVLEIVMNFQAKFFYEEQFHIGLFDHQVDYRCINRGLMIEKVIIQVIEQGIKLISAYPPEEKFTLLRKLTKEWLGCFEMVKTVIDEQLKNGKVNFHPALERVFSSIIRVFVEDLNEENITKFCQETLPGVEVSKLAERVMEGPLRSLGMVRYLHLVHNFNAGKIWHVYYFSNNLFFEMDILAIQIMTAVSNPETLFETYLDNFFAYNKDLREFFNNPKSLILEDERYKQKLLVLEDFLHLLIYVMNDETCRLNAKMCKDIHLASEETQLSTQCHGVIEKVLINLLLGHYSVDVPVLKESMKNVLISHSDVDEILHKVAVIDEKTKKVRVKDEYQTEFDPYIFYKNPSLQSDINQNAASRVKKDQKNDIVSGKFYKNLPSDLKSIQKKLYQSSLPNYLSSFLYNFPDHIATLVRPVLKLILLNLQVVEECLKGHNVESLKTKVQENYLSQNFAKRLSELAQNPDFKDCEPCIEKIQKLIETISSRLHDVETIEIETKESTNHEDQAALKKKLAHQRMLQLKEEFMKKQKMFMHKNPLQAENSARETISNNEDLMEDENGLTCKYCLDKINKEAEGYGMPVYVAFTNNLHDVEENVTTKDEEHPEKLEGSWWPIISSCMHHYHEKCFQSHYESSRKEPDQMGKLYANKFETHCSLCHALCNAFILEERPKTPNQEGNGHSLIIEENESTQNLQSLSFVDTLDALLKDLKEKLRLGPDTEAEDKQIEISEIFRRGYNYFLESFHIAEKLSSFEKTFTIYKFFLKEYISYLRRNGQKLGSIPSLLTKIFTDKHFFDSNEPLDRKISIFADFKPESVFNNLTYDWLVKLATSSYESLEDVDTFNDQKTILKEYVAFKIVQLVLYCKESNPLTVNEIYGLYKEDEELREDVLNALLFPLQKFVLATEINRCVLNGSEKINEKLMQALLEPEDDVAAYLDKLANLLGLNQSFEQIIEESLQELNFKPAPILEALSEMLAYDTSNMSLSEPRSVRLAPKVIELPKTYLDFTTTYLKKKCSQCNEFNRNMSTYICLICGDAICVAYCAKIQKKGNLNSHAKRCHLGMSAFIEIQRMTKVVLACTKNVIYAGKDVYTDKLGQSIQTLMNDPRCLLYSLDFEKFSLNQDFIKAVKNMIEQCNMGKDVYKTTKDTGYYYAEGNL